MNTRTNVAVSCLSAYGDIFSDGRRRIRRASKRSKAARMSCLASFAVLLLWKQIIKALVVFLEFRLLVPSAVLGEGKGTRIAVGMDLVRVRGDENDGLRQKRMCAKIITGSGRAAEQHGICFGRIGRKPSCAEGCEKGDRKWN